MARVGIMVVTGALALLVLFALFYVAGVAIGVAVVPIIILAAIGVVIYGAVKMRRKTP